MIPASANYSRNRLPPQNLELRERDERLESLKAVVGKLAHDFNNFLVPQLGYVALLKEDLPPGTVTAEYAKALEDAGRKSESILDSILLGMRPHRRFNPRTFDIGSLLRQTTENWTRELPTTAQITVQTDIDNFGDYNGDPDQWTNVFNQLLSNSRFALATGGKLEVTLKQANLPVDKQSELGIMGEKVLEIAFKDDGFGMTPEVLKRAFEPFYTTRTQLKVPGIGLSIVHSVVQLHGGQVQVFSEEDIGTAVHIYAPLLELHQLKGTIRTASQKHAAGKILLVEDDPLVREVLRSTLQRHYRDVVLAQNGEEGLYYFKKGIGSWDLIVSDVVMQKLNGIEFVKQVRALDNEVKIILVSGDPAAAEAIAQGLPQPRPLLIKKPFTLRAFNDVVRSYLPAR